MSASVYIFDLRGLDKPTHTTPARRGGKLRPHYSRVASQRSARRAAREAGGIDRIVLHQWAAEVEPLAQASDRDDALKLACRAAGIFVDGRSRGIGGAPYHISVGATRRGSGVVALVWPQWEHTFHASEENARSVGVGVMGLFGRDEEGPERPGLPDALAWALHLAAGLVRDPLDDLGAYLDSVTTEPVPAVRGADAWLLSGLPLPAGLPPVLCTTHSQSANKPHDPGLYVVRHGIAPAVRAGLLTVDPGWHTGGGSAWPRWWADALLAPLPRPE